jgi:hypothetical protein
MNARMMKRTWSVVLVWVELRRNASLFWATLALPAFLSGLFNALSFLLPKSEHSVFVTVLNLFVQSVFLQDALKELPPVVGSTLRIVRFMSALLTLTAMAVCLHLCSRRIADSLTRVPLTYKQHVQMVFLYVGPQKGSPALNSQTEGEYTEMYFTVRNIFFVIYLVLTLFLSLLFLV